MQRSGRPRAIEGMRRGLRAVQSWGLGHSGTAAPSGRATRLSVHAAAGRLSLLHRVHPASLCSGDTSGLKITKNRPPKEAHYHALYRVIKPWFLSESFCKELANEKGMQILGDIMVACTEQVEGVVTGLCTGVCHTGCC